MAQPIIRIGARDEAETSTSNQIEHSGIKVDRAAAELIERFRSILEITANAEGPVKRADEIEPLLIQEMRPLGNATMESWAGRAQRTLGEQLKQKDASAVVRKEQR